jgi:hypothetical protein
MPKNTPRTRHVFSRHVAPFAPVALALLMQSASTGSSTTATTTTPHSVQTPAAGSGFVQTCASPHFPSAAPTTIDDTSCTLAGSGGAETFQNEAKNNFCATGPAKPITIAEMVNLQAQVQQDSSIPFGSTHGHPLTTKPGPATDRKPLQALGEGTAVTLQGFVLIARQEGAESVNCGKNIADIPTNHDIHISIVDSANQQDECSGVVAEMIPHHRPASWTAQNVNAIASKKLPVRLTGQLFFDSSHTPCQKGSGVPGDPKRVALWEVHPIYEFDVCPQGDCSNGNGWVTLEEFLKE